MFAAFHVHPSHSPHHSFYEYHSRSSSATVESDIAGTARILVATAVVRETLLNVGTLDLQVLKSWRAHACAAANTADVILETILACAAAEGAGNRVIIRDNHSAGATAGPAGVVLETILSGSATEGTFDRDCQNEIPPQVARVLLQEPPAWDYLPALKPLARLTHR
jgi:hypothetical protein